MFFLFSCWTVAIPVNVQADATKTGLKSTQNQVLKSEGREIGSVRGLPVVNRQLNYLFFESSRNPHSFNIYGLLAFSVRELSDQLGGYTPSETENQRSGKEINPFNFLIWQRVFDQMAFHIQNSCQQNENSDEFFLTDVYMRRYYVKKAIAPVLLKLCKEEAIDSHDIKILWRGLVGFTFEKERREFSNRFLTQLQKEDKTLQNLIWSILMHPVFILEK